MKKIAFYTLGCKVNQADSAGMEEIFRRAGYEIVDFDQEADIYLVNTCVVTNVGQKKSRQMIQRAVRKNPDSLVVVTGCYPQTAPQEVKALPGVDVVIGNRERGRIVELVEAALARKADEKIFRVEAIGAEKNFEELGAGIGSKRTRAFLKIQEGCNQFCTYCIIPYARGPLRSRSLASIREECVKLVAAGYKEIVLIGIHLGCYGRDLSTEETRVTLYDAVLAALSVEGVQRLRLGSLESVEVEERLLALFAQDERLCQHLHLPLQSGCDKILRAMHRPYDAARYRELLQKIRVTLPDAAITTDVIVGFPGETEADFLETYHFAEECGFAKIHVFPYSPREGTPAAGMAEQVSKHCKSERVERLLRLDKELHERALAAMLGRTVAVLFEQPADVQNIAELENKNAQYMEGLCGAYLRVLAPGGRELANTIARVRISKVLGDALLGEIVG